MTMIPVNEPLLAGNELKYVNECVRTGWVSSLGRFIEEFESRWASYCGMPEGVAVCNGTVALDLAVEALCLPAGSEVILPSFTIISCAGAIVRTGCVPVPVDCDPVTWCMDPALAEAAVTPRTRAIMPVHIYGHPVDMDPIADLAARHGLTVIEDAAEAHGATYKGRRCGGLGHVSCFSFYANKIVTTGEGGMVLVRDPELAARMRKLRNLCFEPGSRFAHHELGHNYRLTNLQAALGLAQIERIDQALAHKRLMAKRYGQGLAGLPLQLPVQLPWAESVYWMYGVVLDEATGLTAVDLAERLLKLNVQTRPFFLGMHQQPALHRLGLCQGLSLPVTERIARQGLYLPSGLALSPEQMDRVIEAMHLALAAA